MQKEVKKKDKEEDKQGEEEEEKGAWERLDRGGGEGG